MTGVNTNNEYISVAPAGEPQNTSATNEKTKDYIKEYREDLLKLSKDQRLDEKQKESLKNVMLFILAITNLQVKEYIKENSKEIINLANALKKEKSVDLLKEKIQNISFGENGKDENGFTKKEYEQAISNMENFITRYASGSTNNTTSEGTTESADGKTATSNEKKTNSEETEKEAPKNDEIAEFDKFLQANNINETFKSMLEKTRDSFKSMITENITKELLKSKRLTEKREDGATVLNKLGNETYGLIEKKLSDERMSNLTYSILNKLLEEAKKKIGKSNGNADVEIQEKAYLFMAMKNIIAPKQKTNSTEKPELKGISSDAAERIWAMVQPSTDLATIEKNLSTFIKDQLKAGGFDIEKPGKSIRKGARENNTSINEAIPMVISDAFDYAFSYLNNTQGAEALLTGLLGDSSDKNKKFDASKIKKEGLDLEKQTTPTGDQLSALAKSLNELTDGLPKENTKDGKIDSKNLKEKLANGKIDGIMDQLEKNPIFSLFKEPIMLFLQKLKDWDLGRSILNLFGKAFGLDQEQLDKILERPLIKNGVNAYKDNIEKIQEIGESIEPISLDKELTDRDIDTNYFRLLNGVVCKKQGNNYMIKQVDKDGNLQEYPQAPVNGLTPVILGKDKTIQIDATGKVTNSDGSAFDASRNLMKEFIESDLHSDSFKTAVTTMLVTKEPKNKNRSENFGNLSKEDREAKIATLIGGKKIPDMVQELLKNNKYVFSTEDIVAHVLEKALEEYKKSKEGKVEAIPTLSNNPKTLKAGTAPTDEDYQKWIKIPDGKTATYSIDPTIDRNNKKAGDTIKDLIVTVTIDGKANKITIPEVTIEAATTTPAEPPAKTETPAPVPAPAAPAKKETSTETASTATATAVAPTITEKSATSEANPMPEKETEAPVVVKPPVVKPQTTEQNAEISRNVPISFTTPELGTIKSDKNAETAFEKLSNSCKNALGAGYENATIELAATSQSSSGRMLENATKKNITSNQELFIIKGIPAISDIIAKTDAIQRLNAINGSQDYTTVGLFRAKVGDVTTYFYVTRKKQANS